MARVNNKPTISLINKIYILFFIVFPLFTGLLGFLSYQLNRENQLITISSDHEELTQNVMNNIDLQLNEQISNAVVFATRSTIRDFLENSDSLEKKQLISDSLQDTVQIYDSWHSVEIWNADGEILLNSDRDEEHQNIKNNENQHLFDQALAGKIIHSDVYALKNNDKILFSIAIPIYNIEKDRTIGVFVVDLDWMIVSKKFFKIDSHIIYTLFNKDAYEISTNELNKEEEVLEESYADKPIYPIAKNGQLTSQILPSINYDYQSLTVIAPQFGVSNFNSLGWFLVSEVPESVALKNATVNSIQLSIALTLLTLIAGVILILIIRQVFIHPISALTNTVQQLQVDNQLTLIPVSGNDEIGILGEAFNNLVSKLLAANQVLGDKVNQQTTKLSESVESLIEKNRTLEDTKKAMLNVLEDIEDERQAVIAERDKINAIIYSIGDAVFVVDREFRIMLINQVALSLSGFQGKDVVGKYYTDVLRFVFEKDESRINDSFIKNAIITGETQKMSANTILISSDGNKYAVSDSAAPLKNNNGEVIGCVVVFRDISKEKEIDQIKSNFLSVASHQLRTPLGAMRWSLELLISGERGAISTSVLDDLKHIYENNLRLINLVGNLLNVSRIDDEANDRNKPENIDLVKFIDVELQIFKDELQKRSILLNVVVKNGYKDEIYFDQDRLRAVLQNLISNAIKYNRPNGQIQINIDTNGQNTFLIISDSGIGIPQNDLPNIYQRFYRGNNAIKSEVEGSGLGLFVVKYYVEAAGGRIEIKSKEGQGTQVIVTVPNSKGQNVVK